ncbi:protein ECT2 isoform X2 [Papilio machaon]|uniref:protein ECT2 isoform X2 n=1 Tax=Papilio machaon TaxID=76193 RepID=UPI001E6651C8|nr:protein ECT2 isoform X2 [Papilio machaon]
MDELSKGMSQTGSTVVTDKNQESDGSSSPFIYVSESCLECERVRAACERLGAVEPARAADALPSPQPPPAPPSYLVTTPFDGDLFDAAHRAKYRVLGPTAVLQLAERDEPPPANARPLYSLAMRGAVICFSGFRKKDELTYLITLIHYMGGSIRKDMSSKVTHLIAAAATGDKYRYATGFGLPVLARSWVDACWERRDDPACLATDDTVIKEHKLKVFAGARVCFVGFPEDETQHMAEVLASNGGATCALDDPDCTHVVVDVHNTGVAPECSPRVHIVKAEWFWASVQNEEAQDEREFLFKDYLEEVSRRSSVGAACGGAGAGGEEAGAGTPSQAQRMRKRKLRGGEAALHKRRSSFSDAVLLSLSGNLLDCTPSPDGKQLLEESEVPDNVVRKLMSPRQQVFMELLQTESNYVGILHTIVTLFKQPLEEMTEDDSSNGKNQPLLNNTELKIIFGNLPPIYELHQRMLEELRYAQAHWSEEVSIGRLVLRYTPDMVKAYPPFVNFFENTKEMLQQCDRENPRFHAFLKICQTRPECGRQSLQELLIRPVQRLPSISLLLDDILKHTHKNNPDHAALVSALAGLREVMSHINEDKRKTEGQLQMFDIYNDIDQCPAHLVSSHRSFVSRCEVVELSKELSGRGDHLVLFLFTDTMEVCKKRSKAFNSKSPTNGMGTMRIGSSKPYRHISLMPLSTVKRVVDIREAEDCHNVFALMCRSNQELKEKLYSFMITDETVDKSHFLRQLCRQMANTVCKADADKFLACLESHQLDIDTSDLALSTLSRVSKFAARTRIKLEALAGLGGWLRAEPGAALLDTWVLRAHLLAQVGRALSFNKTPSKLKRAMSSMISPFGSTSNLTPASQLAQMRLASCNNINEMGTSGGSGAEGGGEVLVAPLSVQPTRKASGARAPALRRF